MQRQKMSGKTSLFFFLPLILEKINFGGKPKENWIKSIEDFLVLILKAADNP